MIVATKTITWSTRYISKCKKGIRRGVKELTPECDPDESHEQFTHAEQEKERGGRGKGERTRRRGGGIRTGKKIYNNNRLKKGRSDRSRLLVVIAHQKTDRGSSNPSRAREFRTLCRWLDSWKDLIRCSVLYISFRGSHSVSLFIRIFVLFLLRCAVPKRNPGCWE